MKIAVVVRSLEFGGMEKVALTLSETFHKQGHESHLIYFNETSKKLPLPKNIHIHSFELKRTMKRSIFGLGYLWQIISQILNIFIRNSYFIWSALYMTPIFKKKLYKVEAEFGKFDLIIFRGQGTFEMIWPLHDERFVFVNEGLIYDDDYGYLKKLYAKLLFKNRNISSISSGVKKSFETIQKHAKFSVNQHILITNPIDIEQTVTLSNKTIKIPETPYIISAGRFHPVKNFPLLIEAYAYARTELGLTQDLLILGEGSERNKITQAINAHNLNDHIHLPGYTENPYPWMKHADLFILTSKHEGLGMVLLESMACGTDIIATDSPGGIKDVMIKALTSHICEANKISLAKKIVEVLDHPIKKFSTYLQPYSASTIAEQFIQNFTPKQN